jgi:hypothetical protein
VSWPILLTGQRALCGFVRLTRRAKHRHDGIIEKFGSARAEQSAAGFSLESAFA